ncbi:amino acid adenylation domain-containing protein [Gordonia malaquae]|uniref:amino acid adenylation domain-containing protein n=1 Tax=Gordonia malaquae TaxID=410332 RepID=UPI0030C79529
MTTRATPATAQPKVVDLWPLSPLQQGLFYVARSTDGVDPYVVQLAVDINGTFDVDRFRTAAAALVDRHPGLRGAFRQRASGEPVVMIVDRVTPQVDVVDLRDAADAESAWTAIVDADHRRGFTVARPPLVRFTVADLGGGRHRLLITNHHLIWDGWSTPIVVADLFRLYAGMDLPEAPSYRSYLGWLAGADTAAADRWSAHLGGLASPTRLSGGTRRHGDPVTVRTTLDVAAHGRLTALARSTGVTVNTVIQAAWALVVSALTGNDDVVFGAVVSGRPADLPDVESTVGLFINTVPVRVRLDPAATVSELLRAMAAEQSALLTSHHVALHDVQARAGLGELFDSLVVFENYPLDEAALTDLGRQAGLTLSITPGRNETDYPVVLTVTPEPTGELDVAIELDATAGPVAAHAPAVLARVLETIASGDDPILARIAGVPADIAPPAPIDGPDLVDDVFAAARTAAAIDPDSVAVDGPDGRVTRGAFWARVERLARRLVRAGAGPDVPVAVVLDRRTDLVTALLAVVRSGAVAMPVDPDYPADRITAMLGDGGPAVAVVSSATADLVAGLPVVNVDDPIDDVDDEIELPRPRPDHGAYLLFTSGSTGRPKPVLSTQRGLATRLSWDLDVAGADRARLAKSSPSFVDGLTEILLAVATASPVVVADDAARRDPTVLADLLATHPVDRFGAVPALLDVLVDDLPVAARPPLWVSSGEALRTDVAARLLAVDPAARLVNSYGSSEVVGDVTVHSVDADTIGSGSSVPIGHEVPGTTVVILDQWLRPVADGVTGDLYVAGPQLARGYPGAPDVTAVRFVADPTGDGTRLYRTGDLVHRDPTGALVFDGRADAQLSIRGFRVEPGEVEAALSALPGVDGAAVTVLSTAGGDVLAGFVVGDVDLGDVRRRLGASLPTQLVPTVLAPVPAIPLSPNGKVDRRALAALDVPAPRPDLHRPPATETERAVAAAVADVLDTADPGMDDDLLSLGGHSLSAARLTARLTKELGVTVGIREAFDHPVLGELADRIDRLRAESRRAESPRPDAVVASTDRPERPRLSAAQERMWFLHRLDGPSAVHTIRFALAIPATLDHAALTAAFADVIERHEVLRTVYRADDDGSWQHVLTVDDADTAVAVIDVEVADPNVVDLASEGDAAGAAVAAAGAHAFDIAAEQPIRLTLIRGADGHSVLVAAVHHIAADEWSAPILVRDLSTAYEARLAQRVPTWRPLPVQYIDYAAAPIPDDALARWTERLAGIPDEIPTPRDRHRPDVSDQRGATVAFTVDAAQTAGLRALGRRTGASMFVLSHVATAVALAQLGAGDDIVLGTPVAGRTDHAVADLVGLFVNTLVLRTRISPSATLGDLVTTVRDIDLDAIDDQQTPFERIVDELAPTRSLTRHPLFQNLVAYRAPGDSPRFAGHRVEAVDHPADLVQFDLSTTVLDDGHRLAVRIDYAVDLFDEATVERIAAAWRTVARALATDPTVQVRDLPAATAADAALVTATWPDGGPAVGLDSLVGALDRSAQAHPTTVAVSRPDSPATVTYCDLAGRANRLARHLLNRGVGADDRVVVIADRSIDTVVSIMGVVAAGAAFVPVDPAQGADRRSAIIDAARPAAILDGLDDQSLGGYSDEPITDAERRAPVRGDHTCYITFTSGSTGVPKGVVVSHAAIANTVAWRQDTFSLTVGGRLLQKTSPAFDPYIPEILWPLAVGATVVLAPDGAERDPVELGELIVEQDVEFVELVPSMIGAMIDAGVTIARPGDRAPELSAGGEALRPDLIETIGSRWDVHLWNTYGPAEAAVEMTAADLHGHHGGPVPIGAPIPGARAYVLDTSLRPVAPGVIGELHIGGRPLARGYLDAPGLTACRFVADPFGDGGRLYRTGDLVRWTGGGALEFIGRTDFQLKIRGMRVEPGEVEAILTAVDGVHAAVATTVGTGASTRLVAYVTTAGLDASTLLSTLRAGSAPAHLVPSAVQVIDAFTHSASGKIDRRALPPFDAADGPAPTGPGLVGDVEEAVAAVMADVLDVPVSVRDADFFALGGHSLIATRLVSGLARATGRRLAVRDVFEHPTVSGLAALVAATSASDQGGPTVSGTEITRAPATPGQRSLWLLAQMDAGAAYENHGVWTVDGRLDVDTLRAAVVDMLERHDVLRTVFEWDGDNLWQTVRPLAEITPTAVVTEETCAAADLDDRLVELRAERTDLASDLPIRIRLFHTGDADVLTVSLHHVVTDETSTPLIYRDLDVAYSARTDGEAPAWAGRPAQYAEYSLWQQERSAPTAAADLESTAAALADFPLVADLPYSSDDRDGSVVYRSARISSSDVEAVRAVASTVRTTPLMVLQFAVGAALDALGAGDRVAVGTPVSLRDDEAFADTVGYFVNTVVLRSDLRGRPSFRAAADGLRTETLTAFDRRHVPFGDVVDRLSPPRPAGVSPIFQVMIAHLDDSVDLAPTLGGRRLAPVADVGRGSVTDIVASLAELPDGGWEVGVDVSDGLFDDSVVDVLVGVAASVIVLIGRLPDTGLDDLIGIARAAVEADPVDVVDPAADADVDRRLDAGGLWTAYRTVAAAVDHPVAAVIAALSPALGLTAEGSDAARPEVAVDRLASIVVHHDPLGFEADDRRPSGGARVLTDGGVVRRLDLLDDGTDPVRLDAAAALVGVLLDSADLTVALPSATDWWDRQLTRAASDDLLDGHWVDVAEAAVDADEPAVVARGDLRVERFGADGAVSGRMTDRAVDAVVEALREAGVDLGENPLVDVEETARRTPDDAFVPGVLTWRYPVLMYRGVCELPPVDEAGDYTLLRYHSVHAQGMFADLPDSDLLVRVHHTDTVVTGPDAAGLGTSGLGDYRAVVTVTITDSGRVEVGVVHDYPMSVDVAAIAGALTGGSTGEQRPHVDLLAAAVDRTETVHHDLLRLTAADRIALTERHGPIEDVWPVTALQEGLLFHLQVAADSGDVDLYASQSVAAVRGRLDVPRMRAAIGSVMQRHPSLRAAFATVAGRSVSVIVSSVDAPIRVYTRADVVRDGVESILAAERFAPFHAERPPLIRFALVPAADDEWLVVFSFEHVLMDGWSIGRLLDDLFALYAGESAAPAASMRACLDRLSEHDDDAAAASWRRYLSGVDEPTVLYPAATASRPDALRAADHHRTLDADLSGRVRRAAAAAGVTVGTFLQTAWGITLGRLTGRTDVVFGTTVAGRPADVDGAERVVGLLFNTVPVRVDLSRPRSVAAQVRAQQDAWVTVLDADHVGLTQISDDAGVPSLFDTLFIIQNVPASVEGHTFGGLEVVSRTVNDATHYPVSFAADPAEQIVLRCAYRSDVLDADEARVLTDRYVDVLTTMATDTSTLVPRIGVTTPVEHELVVQRWNDTGNDVPDVTIAELFTAQARRTPDATALVAGSTVLTFAQMSARVNRLARLLISRGAGPEQRVVLLLPRDERMVLAMFACFAAGAAYVPVDADYPADRIAYMIATADPEVIVGTTDLLPAGRLPAGARVVDLDDPSISDELARIADTDLAVGEAPRAAGDNLAYVIYTSGSTGRPKGVAVGYRGLTNMLVNHRAKIFDRVVAEQGGRRMRIAHTTSFSFDASWEQLFWLLDGHSVDVIDEELRKDPPALLAYYDRAGVDGFDVTPSYGQVLLDAGLLDTRVSFVSLGGEAVPDTVWTALREAPGVSGYNLYGPTEYTINALGADLADSVTSSVGEPIHNTRAYVLDSGLSPVPPNTPGELYLAGAGTARGYLGQPGMTAERFVACPWGDGERMYRTGDVARWRDDGSLDYLGRSDAQVKIRGFRIEPAEVADAIAAVDGVSRAAVRVVTSPSGVPALVGYAVPDADDVDPAAVREALRDTLPDYMVPAVIGLIDDLPLTVNGKLDVAALPDVPLAADELVPPDGPAEEFACSVFADLIGVPAVSATADVFDSGANSLIAMKAAARLNDGEHGFSVRVRDVFSARTPRAIAALATAGDVDAEHTATHPAVTEFAASTTGRRVFCFHEAFGFVAAYASLVDQVPEGWGVVGVSDVCTVPNSVEPSSFGALAEIYADAVQATQRSGPYDLLGWSYGGHLAFAVARALVTRGERVVSLTVVDAYAVDAADAETIDAAESRRRVRALVGASESESEVDVVRSALDGSPLVGLTDGELAASFESHARCERMLTEPTAGSVDVPTVLVYSTIEAEAAVPVESTWSSHLTGDVDVIGVSAAHDELVTSEHVESWISPVRRIWR